MVDKTSELVKEIKKWVDEEYAGGRVTVLTDDEIVACVDRVCEKLNITIGNDTDKLKKTGINGR
jgi:hypothetical protein